MVTFENKRARAFFWRRLLVVASVAGAAGFAGGGSAVLAGLVSGAVPARASAVSCAGRSTSCRAGQRPVLYVARPGDTIWAIAVRFSHGQDPRPLEYRLEAEIGGGVLQPGQALHIP